MRQRIGLAQSILHSPKVLFLDEPTSGLDPMGIKLLRDLILRLNREFGMTILKKRENCKQRSYNMVESRHLYIACKGKLTLVCRGTEGS